MKKLILLSLVAIATISLSSFGQAPEGFKYQAVVRDAGNTILYNQAVGMRMTIQQGSIGGTTVYQETFAPTTNGYGLVNLEIGSGTVVSGDFTTIDWSVGSYFIETAVDLTGGTSYVVMGASQLMSVPYALYANTAENVTNDAVNDADPDPTNELQNWSNLPGIPANIDIDATDDFDGDYNNLTNQPIIPTVPSNVSAYVNDAGYVTTSDDADSDPFNEIELPSGGQEGQILTIVAGVPTWSSNAACTISVGDMHAGGIVFYVDASGCHGLVASTTDQVTGAVWGCYQTTIIGADATAVGAGSQNTIDIEVGCVDVGIAADVCANLSLGGYTDWFLPSRDELNLMYLNIGQGNAMGLGNIGNFGGPAVGWRYWSSTEFNSNNAWAMDFFDGTLGSYVKFANSTYVRAVRAF